MSAAPESDEWERAIVAAEVVVVGPAPPLRGGIAAHTERVIEHLRGEGVAAVAASYARLYPAFLFPGRSQRSSARRPPWCAEVLDVADPRTWWRLRRALARSQARVLVQWWHPVTAPALLAATAGLERERLVAVCHNALPHEAFPAAATAARAVLGRCGVVVCHSGSQAAVVRGLVGSQALTIVEAPLPCLIAASHLEHGASGPQPPELAGLPAASRIFVAAGLQRIYKGGLVLLHAWALARRPVEARLVLIGESYLGGESRRRFEDLARLDPTIVIVNRYVEDAELVRCLAWAEVLVAPHLSASQSGLIPIARALGLPCIVSDAGGLAEQVDADCEVVRAGDADALAVAVESRLAHSPRAREAATTQRAQARRNDFAKDWRRVVEAMGIAGRP